MTTIQRLSKQAMQDMWSEFELTHLDSSRLEHQPSSISWRCFATVYTELVDDVPVECFRTRDGMLVARTPLDD